MASDSLNWEQVDIIIENALQEDISSGDVTTETLFPDTLKTAARLICKSSGVVAGLSVAERVFHQLDNAIRWEARVAEGARVNEGQELAVISGNARAILSGERVALNFLQRLSGIASLTAQFVARVQDLPVKILDTRKTTPGLRILEKYAVTVGGGINHRFGLSDGIMIKDNHIHLAGGIAAALQTIENAKSTGLPVEVETSTLEEVRTALEYGADIIMLDNMTVAEMRRAVQLIAGTAKVEASGGVTLETVRDIARTGVDYISVGALTHSVPAMDIGLYISS